MYEIRVRDWVVGTAENLPAAQAVIARRVQSVSQELANLTDADIGLIAAKLRSNYYILKVVDNAESA